MKWNQWVNSKVCHQKLSNRFESFILKSSKRFWTKTSLSTSQNQSFWLQSVMLLMYLNFKAYQEKRKFSENGKEQSIRMKFWNATWCKEIFAEMIFNCFCPVLLLNRYRTVKKPVTCDWKSWNFLVIFYLVSLFKRLTHDNQTKPKGIWVVKLHYERSTLFLMLKRKRRRRIKINRLQNFFQNHRNRFPLKGTLFIFLSTFSSSSMCFLRVASNRLLFVSFVSHWHFLQQKSFKCQCL